MPDLLPAGFWVRDVAALVAVIAMALLTGAAARRYGGAAEPSEKPGVLRMRARLALDGRRRLHLVETPSGAVLVLTGGGQDQMLTLRPERPAA